MHVAKENGLKEATSIEMTCGSMLLFKCTLRKKEPTAGAELQTENEEGTHLHLPHTLSPLTESID